MTKLAPDWVRTSDPVIRSPARYRWTMAPADPYCGSNAQRDNEYIHLHLFIPITFHIKIILYFFYKMRGGGEMLSPYYYCGIQVAHYAR